MLFENEMPTEIQIMNNRAGVLFVLRGMLEEKE
jgi:hypothetical protein